MIELAVDAYCANCRRFKPVTKTIIFESFDGCDICHHTVVCKRRDECARIFDYIQTRRMDDDNAAREAVHEESGTKY